jgi:hypothetical protein
MDRKIIKECVQDEIGPPLPRGMLIYHYRNIHGGINAFRLKDAFIPVIFLNFPGIYAERVICEALERAKPARKPYKDSKNCGTPAWNEDVKGRKEPLHSC